MPPGRIEASAPALKPTEDAEAGLMVLQPRRAAEIAGVTNPETRRTWKSSGLDEKKARTRSRSAGDAERSCGGSGANATSS